MQLLTVRKLSRLILILAVTLPAISFSQTKVLRGYVRDGLSDERIPFASLSFAHSKAGKLTDSAGSFTFRFDSWPNDTLIVSYVGYKSFPLAITPELIARSLLTDTIEVSIGLDRGVIVNEVIVRKKIDRGLLMWRRIVKRKKFNDRYRFDNFSYQLYNKLELDINRVNKNKLQHLGPLKPFGFILNNVDTTEGAPFLPVYLTETISQYFYQKNPFKTRERITASKTLGVNNESVSKLLGGTDQNVNVYNNFIPVFDKQFVSPISDNGDQYYHYRVVDTQMVNNQRLFHLVFNPKRKGESTFEGDCWVHDTTWAIQKMNLFLSKDANINFVERLHLIQEYSMINDTTWFLAKDKFVVNIAPIGKNSLGFIGRKTTTYRDIDINDQQVLDSLNQNKIKEEIYFAPNAREKTDSFWQSSRHESLSKNEKAVYHMIDTLTSMPLFRKYTNVVNFLGTGYLNVGNYQIGPWFNWFTANVLEGPRVRFDLGTNRHFNKKVILHGYLAYGFGDQKFKYKADALYILNKSPRMTMYGSYFSDLDRGQSYYDEISSDNIFALAIRKNNVPIKFLFKKEARYEFYKEWIQGFSVSLGAVHTNFDPLRNLPSKNIYPQPLTNFETSIRLRYAYLETFLENDFYRSSLGSPYPIVDFRYTKGISGVLNSRFNYSKISASISDYTKVPPYGNIYYNVFAGKTFGTLPFMLLDVAPGNEMYYYNRFAYNLLNKFQYVHDRYAGFNFEHNIGPGLFRYVGLTRKLKFRQFYTVRGLWGSTSEANKALNTSPDYSFRSLDGKTYMEVGTGVDNIFRVLRLDFVWRVLPNNIPSTKVERLGLFFSFRLGF